jgi:hypothetical protein
MVMSLIMKGEIGTKIQDVVAPVLASLTLKVVVGAASNGMAKKWPCLS